MLPEYEDATVDSQEGETEASVAGRWAPLLRRDCPNLDSSVTYSAV